MAAAVAVGLIAGIADARFAAALLVATVTVGVVARVVIAAAAYRQTMAREWPAVAPITDWED